MKRIFDAPPLLAVYETDTGERLVKATGEVRKGELIHHFSAREVLRQPTYLSVQVTEDKHIHLAPEFLQYINHSCDPNTFFDVARREIVCVRHIHPGDEVTFFYPSTEWKMAQAFNCLCRSERCLGRIQGAAFLREENRAHYRFASHILARYAEAEVAEPQ